MDNLSACCNAQTTYDGDGNHYCKKCFGAVETTEAPVVVTLSGQFSRTRYEVHCLNDGTVWASTFDQEKAQGIADKLATADGRLYLVESV